MTEETDPKPPPGSENLLLVLMKRIALCEKEIEKLQDQIAKINAPDYD
jgi:hypothetical protein